jgi:acetyltransferase-like isoleucine patch superfamily enzyme
VRRSFSDSYFEESSNIVLSDINQIKIGKGSYVGKFTSIIVSNDGRSGLRNSSLEIGDGTYIGEYNNIRAGGGVILIGKNCLISQHISIIASNHSIWRDDHIKNQLWSTKNNLVEIGSDVWIGCNSVILPGSIIRDGAVVGAGSVVNSEIPEFAIVKGNPAVVVGYRKQMK